MWLLLTSAGASHATVEEQTPQQTHVFPDPVMPQVHRRHHARAELFPHLHHLSSAPHFVWLFNKSWSKWTGAFLGLVKKPGQAHPRYGKTSGLWCISSSPLQSSFHKREAQLLRAGGSSLYRYQASGEDQDRRSWWRASAPQFNKVSVGLGGGWSHLQVNESPQGAPSQLRVPVGPHTCWVIRQQAVAVTT